MSSNQSSGIELMIISVYDFDGKGRIRYDPEHVASLGRNTCFSPWGGGGWGWGGGRGTLGSVFYLKTMLPGARREV